MLCIRIEIMFVESIFVF
ncbi:hypothetical protein, partial [Plasmodium yoelii yoelii]